MSPPSLPPQQAMQLAAQLELEHKLAEAEALYRQIIDGNPDFHPAYHGLGLLAYKVDKLPLAIELIGSALILSNEASYLRDRGEMNRRLGNADLAIKDGQEAVAVEPGNVNGHYNLGLALADKEDYPQAIQCYQKALSIKADFSNAYNNMGSALEKLEQRPEAETAYRKAIDCDKNNVEAQNNLGFNLSEQGKLEEARERLELAIKLKPDFISAHQHISHLKKYTADDPQLAQLEDLLKNQQQFPPEDRAKLFFAIGKAHDDIGKYPQAFAAFQAGNRLHHQTLGNNEAQSAQQADSIIKHFNSDFFKRYQGKGLEDKTPIFIVGMPRSGTTLTEQILASHADVFGAGELKDLHNAILSATRGRSKTTLAEAIIELEPTTINKIGQEFIDALRAYSSDSTHVTDKMPANYFYIGLIHLALPNAKIIHSMRDPMDSCLSNYTRLFNDTMDFAYDLGTLGRYYNRYMQLMQHWQSVLPEGTILDVRYEDTVADVEAQTRRILDFVGLPWDDNCLEFHKNSRRVRTASVAQVRQPIYKTSVSGWKRFEKQLQPLMDIVSEHREHYIANEKQTAPSAG